MSDLMKQAVANERKVDAIKDKMRALTPKLIFTLPQKSQSSTLAN